MNTGDWINIKDSEKKIEQIKTELSDLRNKEYKLECQLASLRKRIPEIGDVYLFDGQVVIVTRDRHKELVFMDDAGEYLGIGLDLISDETNFHHCIFQYNIFAEQE